MAYKLTAEIDDMSRTEAAALVFAIIKKHGAELVEDQIEKRRAQCDRSTKYAATA